MLCYAISCRVMSCHAVLSLEVILVILWLELHLSRSGGISIFYEKVPPLTVCQIRVIYVAKLALLTTNSPSSWKLNNNLVGLYLLYKRNTSYLWYLQTFFLIKSVLNWREIVLLKYRVLLLTCIMLIIMHTLCSFWVLFPEWHKTQV